MSENTPDINPETVPSPIQPPAKTLLQGISQAYDASRAFFTPAGQIPGMVQKMKASFMTRTSLEYNSRIAQMQGLKKLHLTYGLSAKDPFQRVKVNGQDTLFNRLHIERKRIENPFEILRIDDIDWRFNELDFDIDSSYGGGYEYIRWRSPEYLGLNEKWEELINNNNNNNQLSNSIDQIVNPIESNLVFSIGMVLYEIITVEIPFGEFDAISASKQLVKGKRPSLSEFNQTVIGDLIESCWQQDPKQRISLNDLYDIIMSISKIWNIDQQQSQSSTDTNQNESNQISPSLKQSNESLLKQLAKYISPRQYKKISLLKSQSGTLKRKQSGIKGQQSNSTLKRKNNNNNQNNVKESTKLVNSELNDHNDDKNDQNEDKEAQQAQEDPLQDTQEQNEEEGEEELGEIKKDDEDIFVDEIDYFKRLSDEEEDDYNDNQDNED
ncbi:MAG: hypothetical protein EZS28_026931 [Streblomastix strix]|uniref:Serine-threonine/tyrosine-protein kinase catalytic domain-containing protein n=1 Tax=Streblomastix strix TaxID=222440 RepID=A0A5J4V5A2_9EUKA|nr:MAG: hypothetical protein EZS28_026931 [Streblomastix strix]